MNIGAKVRINKVYPDRRDRGFSGVVVGKEGPYWKAEIESRGAWLFMADELDVVKTSAPSIVADISLKPQAKTVLRHLRKKGHISPAEALIVYGISRLAPSIYDLRKVGYDVAMTMKQDAQGHKYAKYTMAKAV